MGTIPDWLARRLSWASAAGVPSTAPDQSIRGLPTKVRDALEGRKPRPPRRLLIGVFGLAAVAAGVVGMAASTSQWVSLFARVEQPPTVVKHVIEDPDLTGSPVQPPEGCIPADTESPIEVPINTCVWWVLRIQVTNSFPDTVMRDLVVTDHFGAELDGEPISDVPVAMEVITHSRGGFHKDEFETQVRITWCVTGQLVGDECVDGGQLLPGESAYLDMLVWTKLNPSGKQEYTWSGTYEMNSGAKAKWRDQSGVQCSPLSNCPSTPPIDVIAFRPATTPTATTTPSPTADPPPADTATVTRTATRTAKPTRTRTATATPTATRTPRRTRTPTASATATGTPSATRTPTLTATSTPTATATATATATPIVPPEPGAWPKLKDWIAVPGIGAGLCGDPPGVDPVRDVWPAYADLVGSQAHPSQYVYYDGVNLFLRMRLDRSPLGPQGFRDLVWGALVDLDDVVSSAPVNSYERLVMANGIDGLLQVKANTSPDDPFLPYGAIDDLGAATPVAELPLGTYARVVSRPAADDSLDGGDGRDHFLDVQFPFPYLGVPEGTSLRLAVFTSSDGAHLDKDINSTCDSLGNLLLETAPLTVTSTGITAAAPEPTATLMPTPTETPTVTPTPAPTETPTATPTPTPTSTPTPAPTPTDTPTPTASPVAEGGGG